MWIPKTREELEANLPSTSETPVLEFKEQLPAQGKSHDIAVDVAAMSTDGGVIIYGVREDKALQTFSPAPIALQGQKERVGQVVQTRLGGSVSLSITELSLGDGTGYLVVAVPPSPFAPHQVQVKGDYRFYGRGTDGNVILSQGDVDRLYQRREVFRESAERALEEWMDEAELESGHFVLHLLVQPLGVGGAQRRSVMTSLNLNGFGPLIESANAFPEYALSQGTRIADMGRGEAKETPGGALLSLETPAMDFSMISKLEILDDCTVRYALSGLQAYRSTPEDPIICDAMVMQVTAEVLRLAEHLFSLVGFIGQVNLATALSGAANARSADWEGKASPIGKDKYRLPNRLKRPILRVSVLDLGDELVLSTTRTLMDSFVRPLRPPAFPDPLNLKAVQS
jgi:hypothetical protein